MKKRWKVTICIVFTLLALGIIWCISPFPKQIAQNTADNYLKQHYPQFIVTYNFIGDTKTSLVILSYRTEFSAVYQNDKEAVLIYISPGYFPVKVTSAEYFKL